MSSDFKRNLCIYEINTMWILVYLHNCFRSPVYYYVIYLLYGQENTIKYQWFYKDLCQIIIVHVATSFLSNEEDLLLVI